MAFRAFALTMRAVKADIKRLTDKKWWVKFIAKTIAQKGAWLPGRRKPGRKTKGPGRTVQGHYTRAEARRISAAIIARRVRAVSFVAIGWLDAIRDLKSSVPSKDRGSIAQAEGKRVGQKKGRGTAAKGSGISLKIQAIAASFSVNPKNHSRKPFYYAMQAAEKAVKETTADMLTYIHRKMREAANQSGVPMKDSLTGRIFVPR